MTFTVAVMLAAALAGNGVPQYETPTSTSAYFTESTEASAMPEIPEQPNINYELGLQELEEGNIPQAIVNFTNGYGNDKDPELSLEQLRLLRTKYGNDVDIPLLDMLDRYHDLKYSVGKFVMADSKGKYGALDAYSGEPFLPFVYDGIDEISSSSFSTYWTVTKNGKKGLVDAHTAEETLPAAYDDFFPLETSYLSYGFPVPDEQDYVANMEYIRAKKDGKTGVVAMQGNRFYPVDGTIDEFYPVKEDGNPGDAMIVAKTANAEGDTIYSVRTLGGKTIIGPELNCSRISVWKTYISLYREKPAIQFAWAKNDGTIMQDFMPEYSRDGGKYAALVDRQNKWSFYDLYDWQKLNALGEFDNVMEFDGEVFAVNRGGKWALLDVEDAEYKTDYGFPVQPGGDEFISYIAELLNGEMEISEKDRLEAQSQAVIMVDGKSTLPMEIKDNDISVAYFKDANTVLRGVVGTDGKTKLRPEYLDLQRLNGKRYLAYKLGDDNYTVIDSNGNKLRDTSWDKIVFADYYKVFIVKEKGTDLYGIFDMDLGVIHPCKFSDDEVYELLEALDPDEE